jgi:hypothetical protein
MDLELLSQPLYEGSSRPISIIFKDETGQPFIPSTIEGTLYDVDTGTIINGREDQNLLEAGNGGSFSGTTFTIKLKPADLTIINDARGRETHRLRITTKWGLDNVHHTIIEHVVINLERVP